MSPRTGLNRALLTALKSSQTRLTLKQVSFFISHSKESFKKKLGYRFRSMLAAKILPDPSSEVNSKHTMDGLQQSSCFLSGK